MILWNIKIKKNQPQIQDEYNNILLNLDETVN